MNIPRYLIDSSRYGEMQSAHDIEVEAWMQQKSTKVVLCECVFWSG